MEGSIKCILKKTTFLLMIYQKYHYKVKCVYRIYCRVNTFNLVYLQQQKRSKLIVSNVIFVYKY